MVTHSLNPLCEDKVVFLCITDPKLAKQRTDNGLHGSGYSSAATMTMDYRLTSIRKKVKNIKQYELSGRKDSQFASLEPIPMPRRSGSSPACPGSCATWPPAVSDVSDRLPYPHPGKRHVLAPYPEGRVRPSRSSLHARWRPT